jgi:predicted 3-demethylubiquinone-9 3-methyltransferase (glyoxalase superfamily)
MQKLSTCLWFNNNAEEAVQFYTTIFKDSKVKRTTHYGKSSANVSGQSEGSVLTIEFEIADNEYLALNGGPIFSFTPAVSIIVTCETQEEIDYYWTSLSQGGQEVQCGWLTDKFGLSWQVVPKAIEEMLHAGDPKKCERMMACLLAMKKLDISTLINAYEGS